MRGITLIEIDWKRYLESESFGPRCQEWAGWGGVGLLKHFALTADKDHVIQILDKALWMLCNLMLENRYVI